MSTFVPELWGTTILEAYENKFAGLFGRPLHPMDSWAGETFEEVCAFAAVCEVALILPNRLKGQPVTGGPDELRLVRPGHQSVSIPLGPPKEILEVLKKYATDTQPTGGIASSG